MFFTLAILLTIFSIFIYWFLNLECDLETYYALKFGHPIEKLRGKVIWITGASSGIGEHLAYVCASVGAKLILSGTNEQRLKEVSNRCITLGKYDPENIMVLPFNVADCDCHTQKFGEVLRQFNRLDILVNNAGRSQRASFLEIDPEVDRQLFAINVFGLVNLTRVVVRYFLAFNPDGQIAVTSSAAGLFGAPFSATYTASKHALHGYFECLRNELGNKNIAITLWCVGPTFSNFLEKAFTGKPGEVVGGKQPPNSRKMSTDRCAQLMAIAMVNKIDQAWISIQPFLIVYYLCQYFPQIFRKIMPRIMSESLSRKLRDGQ